MRCKPGWSLLRVEKRRGKKMFVHGKRVVGSLRAEAFDPNMSVHVVRKDALCDIGKTVEMGGHDGAVRFDGLVVVIAEEHRFNRNPPFHAGVAAELLAEWLEPGDEVLLSIFPAQLRQSLSFMRVAEEAREAHSS